MSLRCRSFGLLYYRSVGKMPLEPDHADLESIGQSRFHILLNDSLRCRKCRIVIHYLYQYLVGNFFPLYSFGSHHRHTERVCFFNASVANHVSLTHERTSLINKVFPVSNGNGRSIISHVLSSPLTVLYIIVYCTTKSGECQEVV